MYLRKDENDPSLQQLSFRQMFQQLIFQHDLAHLVLSMDFLEIDRSVRNFLDLQINPILFFASEEFRYNRDKLDHRSDQR